MKLWKSANVKLNLLCNLDNIDATSFYGISRKILFHLQKYYNYISLKLLPYSNEKCFYGNIRQCYRLDKYQRNSLHLFTKLHSSKKHIKLIHNQKKMRYINHEIRNNYLSINKRKNNKEEINSKINSNYTWNSNGMKNCKVATTFFPKIEMEKNVPLYDIVDLFANLNLDQVKSNTIPANAITKFEDNLNNTGNDKSTLSNNINSMCKVMMEESFHHPFTGKSNDIIQLSNYNYINTNYSNTQCKVNCNSGDNLEETCSNIKYLINDIPPKEAIQIHSEDVSCKTRSIQWSTEVDVIYYAGDANGGK